MHQASFDDTGRASDSPPLPSCWLGEQPPSLYKNENRN